jgi:hypothetical protein
MTGLRSWALGTLGLWVALAAAVAVARARPLPPLSAAERRTLVILGLTACAVQAAHFCEELLTGFFTAFPRVLGLAVWNRGSFVAFNVTWLVVWVASVSAASRGRRFAEWPLWFLALALVVNGVAHPVLAVRAGAYFPGLVTSVFAFLTGGVLLRWMVRVTRPAS